MPFFQRKNTPRPEQTQYNQALSSLNQLTPHTEGFTESLFTFQAQFSSKLARLSSFDAARIH
jgi:hypothetical protein